MEDKSRKTIRAAGGIVNGTGGNDGKIAVVRRRRYGGEIGLPKGKVNKGETEIAAALREVGEETGLRVELREPVGTTHYEVNGRPKSVSYFMMDAPDDCPASPQDTGEVEAVEWLTPAEAVAALTHEDDRKLVTEVFKIGEKPP